MAEGDSSRHKRTRNRAPGQEAKKKMKHLMKYLMILAGLTILSVGSIASNTLLENEDTFTFTNSTGAAVNDLHIEWSRAVKVKSDTPFKKTSGSGSNKTDHSKGSVAAGATASVTVTWNGSDPKVKR